MSLIAQTMREASRALRVLARVFDDLPAQPSPEDWAQARRDLEPVSPDGFVVYLPDYETCLADRARAIRRRRVKREKLRARRARARERRKANR
jgi:hypothetical protein